MSENLGTTNHNLQRLIKHQQQLETTSVFLPVAGHVAHPSEHGDNHVVVSSQNG